MNYKEIFVPLRATLVSANRVEEIIALRDEIKIRSNHQYSCKTNLHADDGIKYTLKCIQGVSVKIQNCGIKTTFWKTNQFDCVNTNKMVNNSAQILFLQKISVGPAINSGWV